LRERLRSGFVRLFAATWKIEQNENLVNDSIAHAKPLLLEIVSTDTILLHLQRISSKISSAGCNASACAST